MSFLLLMVMRAHWSALVATVGGWWLYEEALVALCSAWRMFDWWQVLPGQEQCSARVGFRLGALSLVILGALAAIIHNRCSNAAARP